MRPSDVQKTKGDRSNISFELGDHQRVAIKILCKHRPIQQAPTAHPPRSFRCFARCQVIDFPRYVVSLRNEYSMKRFLPFVLLFVGFAGHSAAPVHAQTWLTPSEVELIAALGLDVRINGKTYHREPDYDALVEIGNRALEPLKSRILAMAEAYPKISRSPEQLQEFKTLVESAAKKMQERMRSVALTGESPSTAVNILLDDKNSPIRVAWRKQTEWYLDEADGREAIAKNMNLVTSDFERRIGNARPASDLSLTLAAENGALVIKGKASSSLTAAVVQVVIHKAKANGSWQRLNSSASAGLAGMGVNFTGDIARESAKSAEALEKTFDLPIIKTFGIPSLRPGSHITIDLGEELNDVIFFERVSLKAWTAEGTISLDHIPSMESLQKLREEVPRDERFKATAGKKPNTPTTSTSRGGATNYNGQDAAGRIGLISPGFGGGVPAEDPRVNARQQAQKERQAVQALNFARSALGRKQNDQAKIFLNQTITLAPDSRAAKTASALLKKLDK